MPKRYKKKRMYAVSLKGVGIISGTMAYSRRRSIQHFMNHNWPDPKEWFKAKHAGYRTVLALVETVR